MSQHSTSQSVSLPQRLPSSTSSVRMLQNRSTSTSDAIEYLKSVKQPKRRWSDQNRVDRALGRDLEISSGEENISPSPSSSFEDSEEINDFDTYPYPINVHRDSNHATEIPELQSNMTYQTVVAQTWPYYHYGLYYGMLARSSTLDDVNNEPTGTYYPETPSLGQAAESDSTITQNRNEDNSARIGEIQLSPLEPSDKYQVVETFKQVVSLLPPVQNKPDAFALSPIPSTKRMITAMKSRQMLPDKFPNSLHGPSDRHCERIFFFDSGNTPIQWLGYGRQHALIIGIRTQDHPAFGLRLEGTFKNLYNKTREMLYVHKGNLYYAGTYKCLRIEQMIGVPEFINSLDISLISKSFLKADIIKAVVHAQPPHRTPNDPALRLDTRKMTELCLNGTIKFEWVALQCVGFDDDVFQGLGGQYMAVSAPIMEHLQNFLRASMDDLNAEQGAMGHHTENAGLS